MAARRIAIIVVLVIPIAVLFGVILLFAGLKGAANYAESACFDALDAHPGYGGYGMSGGNWPPSFECELRGNGLDPIVVEPRSVAAILFLTWVMFPTLIVANLVVGIWWFGLRRGTRFPAT